MTDRGPVWVGLGIVVIAACTISAGCTSSDREPGAPTSSVTAVPEADSAQYRLELGSTGDPDRRRLAVPVPTGRTVDITVNLGSEGETILVDLVAALVRSDADGAGQEIELRVVDVGADDPETVAGLRSIVGASSVLRRDRRLAVVEQVLDVPDDLAFRADAVARQALRAPFSLVGPLPLDPVGLGATWQVRLLEEGETVEEREVSLVGLDDDGYTLSFAVPGGDVEIVGRLGALLPDRQVITLVDAELTVTAARMG